MEKNVWIDGNGLHGALKEKTSSAFSLWKGGKITLSLLLFFLFALHLLIPVHAEGQWVNQENGWYYYSDGNEPYTGWIRSAVSGRWYYTVKGKMQTGWVSWKGWSSAYGYHFSGRMEAVKKRFLYPKRETDRRVERENGEVYSGSDGTSGCAGCF